MNRVIALLIVLLLCSCAMPADETQMKEQQNFATPIPTQEVGSEIITEFSTELLDKESGRLSNIKLACQAVNDMQLNSGDEFSFNDVVGERTEERGYEEATILVGTKKGKGYGGGVCQLSSTIYNAALEANLEITERHQHQNAVGYIELGRDAAVSYGTENLKFINTLGFPIKIQAQVIEDTQVMVKLIK